MAMLGHNCVLITGGCGAIGSVLVNTWTAQFPDTRFVNLDALTYCGKAEHIELPHTNYKLYHGSICDADLVTHILDVEQPTLLVHLAAETHVDTSFGNSLRFTETNVVGTHVLLECARRYGKFRRIIHMSTDEVYGAVADHETCHEDAMFAPSNPYAATKAGAEMLCHAYLKSFRLPILIARCNNAVSPYQHPEKLIPKCIECISRGQRVPIHGDGSAKRTFIDARDIASAFEVIAAHGAIGGIYNIGTDSEWTVLDVVRHVAHVLHPDRYASPESVDVNDWAEWTEDRAFQDQRYAIDASSLRRLGWSARYSFNDAVQSVIAKMKEDEKKKLA